MGAEQEITRLRDRSHEQGNHIQELIVKVGELGGKLDGIHMSLKDDLRDIKTETRETNGRVSDHDRAIARVQGMGIAFAAGMPFVLWAIGQLVK